MFAVVSVVQLAAIEELSDSFIMIRPIAPMCSIINFLNGVMNLLSKMICVCTTAAQSPGMLVSTYNIPRDKHSFLLVISQ